ncbi:MAG: HesA/MoeB/ThiF family protein [Rikenellaceae bacterium]
MNQQNKERYMRQIALDEVGQSGQEKLAHSSALIVGVGGLGSPIATVLCSAGFKHLILVDSDIVSLSNLPRQTLYTTEDLGLPKVERAALRLRAMNPNVTIETHNIRFDHSTAEQLIERCDMIIDGCDNMATRYVIDHYSKKCGKPYIYGAIRGFEGQVSVFNYNGKGSYSDLFPASQAAAPQAPPAVMATTPALIGTIEANEALKIAIGYGQTLEGKLLTLDSRNYSFNIFEI